MKKFLSIFLITAVLIAQLTFAFSALPVKAKAETENKCGDSITWFVDTISGVLTLSGTGKTYEYDIGSAPWDKYADYITSIVVSEGITHIQEGTLNKLTKAVSLSLPSSIEEINTTAGMMSLETITFADGVDVRYVDESFCNESVWYRNIPDGSLIYFGTLLQGIKGDVPENTTIKIADGTIAVKNKAFYNQANIVDVIFPYTLKYIGEYAFEGTGWYNSQPDGLIYVGSVLLEYKGTMSVEERDSIVLKDGIKGIGSRAFREQAIHSITIPATVEEIGKSAFGSCVWLTNVKFENGSVLKKIHQNAFNGCDRLTEFEIPNTVIEIGKLAFNHFAVENVYIPASVLMLENAFGNKGQIQCFEVSPDNPNYSSDSDGVIFNKDKTVLYDVPGNFNREEYTVPSGVLYIADQAFYGSGIDKVIFNNELQATGEDLFRYSSTKCVELGNGLQVISGKMFGWGRSLIELVVPKNINLIETNGFYDTQIDDVYFLSENVVFDGRVTQYHDNIIFHCYTDSTAQKYAEEYGINYVLFDDEHYTVEIDKLLTKTEGIYRPYYTDESLAELDAVLNKIDLDAEGLTQYQIDDWC